MVARWWARGPSRSRRGDRDASAIAPASLTAGSTAGLDGEIAEEIEAFRTRAAIDMVMLDALVGMQRIDDAADGIDDQRRALADLQASLESVLVTAVAQRDADAPPLDLEPDGDEHDLEIAGPADRQARPAEVASRMGPSLAGAVAAAALAMSLPLAINAPPALDPVVADLAAPDPGIALTELEDARRMLAGLVGDGTTSAGDPGWVDVDVAIAEARHAHRAILDLPARTLHEPLIRDEVVAVLAAEDAVLAGLEHTAPEAGRLRAELGRLRGTLARVERDGVAAVPVSDVIGELGTAGARVEDLVEAVAPPGDHDEPGDSFGAAVPEPTEDPVDHLEASDDRLDVPEPAVEQPGLTP